MIDAQHGISPIAAEWAGCDFGVSSFAQQSSAFAVTGSGMAAQQDAPSGHDDMPAPRATIVVANTRQQIMASSRRIGTEVYPTRAGLRTVPPRQKCRRPMTHLALPIVALLAAASFAQTGPTTLPAIGDASPGEIVGLPIATLAEIPTLPVTIAPVDGPPLLFSDGPEYFPSDGIALREDVAAGRARFMIYHCPEATGRRSTITAVVQNLGDAPMTLHFSRYSFPKPSLDYQAVGRTGMADFFADHPGPADRVVPVGGRVVLDPAMDATTVAKDELVHAFGEFDVSQPARLTVLQRAPDAKTLDAVDTLPTLASKHHGAGRGTFPSVNFEVSSSQTIDAADGPKQLVVADGKNDPWVKGRDAIENVDVRNVGNYGVVYRVRVRLTSGNGKRVAVVLVKPQDDKGYCPGTTAAVLMRTAGERQQVVALPASGMLRQFPQAALIGIVSPPRDASIAVDLAYTPPAASCLPTPILFVPID